MEDMEEEVTQAQQDLIELVKKKTGGGRFHRKYVVDDDASFRTGENNFSVAVDVTDKKTNVRYSAKFSVPHYLEDEVKFLDVCKHENIIKLHEVIIKERFMCMIMEWSTFKHRSLNSKEAKRIFVQIGEAVKYAHAHNYLLRTIDAKSIRHSRDVPPTCFKIFKVNEVVLEVDAAADKLKADECYINGIAPEYFATKMHTKKNDVWSLGTLLYRMLCASCPFKCQNDECRDKYEDMLNHIKSFQYDTESPGWLDLDTQSKNFISRILTSEDNRPTIEQLLNDDWVIEAEAATSVAQTIPDNNIKSEASAQKSTMQNTKQDAMYVGVDLVHDPSDKDPYGIDAIILQNDRDKIADNGDMSEDSIHTTTIEADLYDIQHIVEHYYGKKIGMRKKVKKDEKKIYWFEVKYIGYDSADDNRCHNASQLLKRAPVVLRNYLYLNNMDIPGIVEHRFKKYVIGSDRLNFNPGSGSSRTKMIEGMVKDYKKLTEEMVMFSTETNTPFKRSKLTARKNEYIDFIADYNALTGVYVEKCSHVFGKMNDIDGIRKEIFKSCGFLIHRENKIGLMEGNILSGSDGKWKLAADKSLKKFTMHLKPARAILFEFFKKYRDFSAIVPIGSMSHTHCAFIRRVVIPGNASKRQTEIKIYDSNGEDAELTTTAKDLINLLPITNENRNHLIYYKANHRIMNTAQTNICSVCCFISLDSGNLYC